jgi:IS6 family transposase
MSAFKWRHFAGAVILWAVRWYCRYGISYRELEEMLRERGVEVDHTTLYRWTQRYAPELEKRTAWYRSRISFSWRVDETYVRVKGRWKYLYRAIDKEGGYLQLPDRAAGWLHLGLDADVLGRGGDGADRHGRTC